MIEWVRNMADIAHGPYKLISMSKSQLLMRRYAVRYALEFVVIFVGVVVSFSVQRIGEEKRQAQETQRLIYTLTTEIESNLDYCEEHLKQLRNMAAANEAILSEGRLDRDFLIAQHDANPFGHSYLDNGQYRYWTTPEDYEGLYLWMVTWWNTFAQNEIYFNSLVASGLLLHIEDPALRESIEAVYTTKKRRVMVAEGLLRDNSEKVLAWAERKRDAAQVSRSRADIFTKDFDLPLRNLLEDRSHRIGIRVMSLEYYIASLQGLHDDLVTLFGQDEGEV